mgnify:FL=1
MVFRNILIAEDNVDHADLILEGLLEGSPGIAVHRVSDGQLAIDYLEGAGEYSDREAHPIPELIMLDIKMPRKTGLEVLKYIKTDAKWRYIPVVMLTTSRKADEVNLAFELGACSYLVKPEEYEEFMSKMSEMKKYWQDVSERPSKS